MGDSWPEVAVTRPTSAMARVSPGAAAQSRPSTAAARTRRPLDAAKAWASSSDGGLPSWSKRTTSMSGETGAVRRVPATDDQCRQQLSRANFRSQSQVLNDLQDAAATIATLKQKLAESESERIKLIMRIESQSSVQCALRRMRERTFRALETKKFESRREDLCREAQRTACEKIEAMLPALQNAVDLLLAELEKGKREADAQVKMQEAAWGQRLQRMRRDMNERLVQRSAAVIKRLNARQHFSEVKIVFGKWRDGISNRLESVRQAAQMQQVQTFNKKYGLPKSTKGKDARDGINGIFADQTIFYGGLDDYSGRPTVAGDSKLYEEMEREFKSCRDPRIKYIITTNIGGLHTNLETEVRKWWAGRGAR